MICLNPKYHFLVFDKQKLAHIEQIYDKDFSEIELIKLEDQLESYIMEVKLALNFQF